MIRLCRWCGIKLPKGARGEHFCCNEHYQEYRHKLSELREEEEAQKTLQAKPMTRSAAIINAYLLGKSDMNIDEVIKQVFGKEVEK